jgi:hypothetical protein
MRYLPTEFSSFLPYQHFKWEEEGFVTHVFLNKSSIYLSTFMNNKESCCCCKQPIEIEASKCIETNNVSDYHLYNDNISFKMVRNSKFTSFGHTIPSQATGYVKINPRET